MLNNPTWIFARQQAEMHRELVGQQVTAPRGLDRVHVADDVGDRHVRCGELLDKPRVTGQPGDRRPVAPLGHELAAELGDRRERAVVDLAAREEGNFFVEQRDELPQDAALGLAPQAQQDEVVTRQDGIHELRDDGIGIAHDAREERRAVLEEADQILAQLVLDGAVHAGGAGPLGLFQLAQRGRLGHMAIVNPAPRGV